METSLKEWEESSLFELFNSCLILCSSPNLMLSSSDDL